MYVERFLHVALNVKILCCQNVIIILLKVLDLFLLLYLSCWSLDAMLYFEFIYIITTIAMQCVLRNIHELYGFFSPEKQNIRIVCGRSVVRIPVATDLNH